MAGTLEGRSALVTGASSGIGEATAAALAAQGAQVTVGARRTDRLEELARRIADAGGTAHPIEVDVADEGSARSFVEEGASRMGGVDLLVNNAGVMLLGAVEGADTGQWRTMVEVNLLGLLYCTHAALPLMRESGGGHVVNVSSVAGRSANAGSAVYNLTKFGVTAFSEALRQEVLEANVRVTCVEPGFVETELQGHNEDPAVLEAIEKVKQTAGEVLTSEDIADAIVYAATRPPRMSINEILVRPTGQRR